MRTSTAFFAGAGTIIAAIGLGLGGGLMVASMTNPNPDRHETSLLERRKSDDLTRAATTQQPPIPYLAATVSAANVPAVTAPAALAKSATAAPPPTDASAPAPSNDAVESDTRPAEAVAAKSAATSEPAAKSPRVSPPDNANARAREADLKRLSDKQKAERRQRWADRQPTDDRKQRGEVEPRGDQWSDHRVNRDRREHEERDGAQDAWNDASRRERAYFNPDRRVRGYRDGDYDRDEADRRDDLGPPIRMFELPRFGIFGAN